MLSLLLISAAFADVTSAHALAQSVTTLLEKKPPMHCTLTVETGGSDGKTTENQREEFLLSIENDKQIENRVRMWKDGKELTPDEMHKADITNAKSPKDRNHADLDDDTQPFTQKGITRHDFAIERDEILWGHATHVLRITAHAGESGAVNGTAWIDVATNVPLKMDLEPAKLPMTMQRLHILAQFLPSPQGAALPSLFKLDGDIKFLWKRATFSHTMTWSGCH